MAGRRRLAAAGVPHVEPYALRHSSIVRGLRSGVPVRIVAALHDTSTAMIEKHYSAFILDAADELARRAVVPLVSAAAVAALDCRVMPAEAKRGRKPSPLPTGMVRVVRTRHEHRAIYAEGWPEG